VVPAHPAPGAECDIAAFGIVEATPDLLATLRKNPQPPGCRPLPGNFLKYSDDQTVAALAAVLRAVHEYRLEDRDFTNWAVVAAPRFLGRTPFTAAIDKFHRQGASAVSPLIIPFLSLHVVSGTISMALRIHGPNLGVGGGEGGLVEALLTGLAVAAEDHPPGVWVVLTEWGDQGPSAGGKDRPAESYLCRAVALALVPAAREPLASLRCSPPATIDFPATARPDCPEPTLATLAAFLVQRGGSGTPRHWVCPLSWGGSLELTAARSGVLPAPGGSRPPLVA